MSSSLARRTLTWLTVVALGTLAVLALAVAPPDRVQGDAQRLMYLHVPAAWVAYVAFAVTSLASALYLRVARATPAGTAWPQPRPNSGCCSRR